MCRRQLGHVLIIASLIGTFNVRYFPDSGGRRFVTMNRFRSRSVHEFYPYVPGEQPHMTRPP